MSRLPSAYQEVEYIENTGRQYIDTGITPDNDTDIGITASDVSEGSAQLFVAGGSFRLVKYSTSNLIGATIGGTSITSNGSGIDKFKAKIENKTFYFNGTSIGSSTDTISTSYTLELFRGNYGAAQYYSKFKCYRAYVKQNGTTVLDLIPCYRVSDNEIGMYDLVNDTFYTNDGTGTFGKGADIITDMLGGVDVAKGAGEISVVNGIIQQYKASTSTIDANTFVEFVNDYTLGSNTQIALDYYTSYSGMENACKIDNNKVFIAYSDYDTGLYGVVCTISGTTITTGTVTQILANSSSSYYDNNICTTLIDTNKIFVCCANSNSGQYPVVCTISGTNITVGTALSAGAIGYPASGVKLADNKVLVSARYTNGIYCTIYTVNGTTITKESNTSVESGMYDYRPHSVLIDNNKIFIAHNKRLSGKDYSYGLICTINGTSVTAGTDTQLSTIEGSGAYEQVNFITTNKVLVTHGRTSYSYIYGIVCTVSGTTITVGTDTQLTNNFIDSDSCGLLENKVFISGRNGNKLSGAVVEVSNMSVSVTSSPVELADATSSSGYPSLVFVDNDKGFVAYKDTDGNLSGIVTKFDTYIKPSNIKIDGITKTECTTTSEGEVYVL